MALHILTNIHLTSALHTLQRAGLREHKLHGLVADLEVRLLLRIFLHELRQTGAFDALEGLQLAVLEVIWVKTTWRTMVTK